MPTIAPIRSDQYPATDEVQCVTVYIPAGNEFKALLAGLYNVATEPQNYDDPDSAQTDGLCAVWDTAYNMIDWGGCNVTVEGVQSQLSLWTRFARNNFAPVYQFNLNQPFAHYLQQPSVGLVNQYFAWDVYLTIGTWNLECLYVRQANSGIASIGTINNSTGIETVHVTQDMNGSFLLNQAATTSFTITESRGYSLFVQVKTKSGASGGYLMGVTGVNLWRSL